MSFEFNVVKKRNFTEKRSIAECAQEHSGERNMNAALHQNTVYIKDKRETKPLRNDKTRILVLLLSISYSVCRAHLNGVKK